MTVAVLQAAEALRESGVSAEVLDLGTISPLPLDDILASVEKTGALVVVQEAWPVASIGSEIIAAVASRSFGRLRVAPRLISTPDVPVPFNRTLADGLVPNVERVVDGVLATLAPEVASPRSS
jgi:pyruvate dehydrogenase E1 component beta subunit